jgi:hypothetical protein
MHPVTTALQGASPQSYASTGCDFQELENLITHPAAEAVYQIVEKEYPNISFDTVNRTLLTLLGQRPKPPDVRQIRKER